MDDQMRVLATEATNFALGNQSHLAPEVLDALARKGRLPRHSVEEVVIPLAHQPSFALGVTLFEICAGIHPLPGYPAIVDVASAFDRIEFDDVRQLAGLDYTDVVRGLLQFEPQARLAVDDAYHRLEALRVQLCSPRVNGPAHGVGVNVDAGLPPVGDHELETRQAATIAALQAALEEQRAAARQAEDRAARERDAREREFREAQAALAARVEEQRIAATVNAEARVDRERVAEQALRRCALCCVLVHRRELFFV